MQETAVARLAIRAGSGDTVEGEQRAASELQVNQVMAGGTGRGRGMALGAKGGKPPQLAVTNPGAKEGGDEHSQPTAGEDDAGGDEELKRNLRQEVFDITAKVVEMERQVTEVNRMRASLRKTKSLSTKSTMNLKDREKDKGGPNSKKQQQQLESSRRDAARTKRMADLIRQLGTVLKQITQHKWAWPFMEPVNVQALGLLDYHEIIKKPMDLGTIRDRMDGKDGTMYKHIQEICDDVRLVFSNASTYNQDGSDVHIMAKTLSEKFEEKWKTLLVPKLLDEEVKRKQEDKDANAKEAAALQAAEEAATEKMAVDVSRQLEDLDRQLEELKQKATPRCRIMSIEEKRQLGHSLGRLPADNLQRVIQIIAQKNPGFNATADEVEVDIDAQEPATLWRLHRYVQSVTNLKVKALAQRSPIVTSKRENVAGADKPAAKRSRKVASS